MGSPVPAVLLHRFDNQNARPVIVAEYTAMHGWTEPRRRVVLTRAAAYALLLRDVTMVKARWRLRTIEFHVTSLRPPALQRQA